jgi:hypothetical protein
MVGDPQALEISYQTGRMNDATSLAAVPIIDVRSYLDLDYADGTSDVHNAYHSRTMRQRLIAANGNANNQVILTTATLGTLALDQSDATGPCGRCIAKRSIRHGPVAGRHRQRHVVGLGRAEGRQQQAGLARRRLFSDGDAEDHGCGHVRGPLPVLRGSADGGGGSRHRRHLQVRAQAP